VLEFANNYIAGEQAAKVDGRGIWAGKFIQPERWRQGERLAVCE